MSKAANGLLDFLSKASVTLPEEVIEVPEWSRSVTLRGFSSRERDEFEADNLTRAQAKSGNGVSARRGQLNADLTNFRARLVARSIVEDGERTCANARGEKILGDQPAAVLDRLFAVCQRLHGMSNEDVEKLAGESVATAEEDSSSASH
jgi:hypothetical protein